MCPLFHTETDFDRARSISPAPLQRGRSPSRSPSRSPVRRVQSRSRGRSYTRSPSYSSRSRSYSRSPSPRPTTSSKIIIEKLTKNVTREHIQEIFSTYGKIESIDMPLQRYYPVNRGVAYIIFDKVAEADKAIEHMHEGQIDGTSVNVSIVVSRPPAARGRSRSPPRRPRGYSPPRRGYGRRFSPPRRGGFRGGFRGDSGGFRGGFGNGRSDTYRPRSRSPYRRDGPDRGRRRRSPSYSSYSSRSPSPARGRSRSPPRRRDRSLSGSRSPTKSPVDRRRKNDRDD